MNGDDRKWIKELLVQHNNDQRDYFNARFDSIQETVKEVQQDVRELRECHSCLDEKCRIRQEESNKRNNKLFIGVGLLAAAVLGTIQALWCVDAIAIAKSLLRVAF